MKEPAVFLPRLDSQKPSEDFFALRREGIGYIEQAGSRHWTDYNTHDPGITILEALCYALTDIAYRSGWDIKDLLTLETSTAADPFPRQAFYTAREILTSGPVTPNDFRRVLIDLEPVRNAWIFCKQCACETDYYVVCDEDRLALSYRQLEQGELDAKKVTVSGLYEVLLELESDPELGDLNARKIQKMRHFYDAEGRVQTRVIELRFPDLSLSAEEEWQAFLDHPNDYSVSVRIGATDDYDVLTDPLLDQAGKDRYLKRHWRELFYVDFQVDFQQESVGLTLNIDHATLRVFGNADAKEETTLAELVELLEDVSDSGIVGLYRRKVHKIAQAVEQAKQSLHKRRNLDEDFCRIEGIALAEIAVCADVEVASDADIDRVQARIWQEIEHYLNPPIAFYSLQELRDEGLSVEAIFNGPALDNGFIKSEDLQRAMLKSEIRASDIIKRLMAIDGVLAVNNLLLTLYDPQGRIVKGKADPIQQNDGKPLFDPDRISAAWLLMLDDRRQPRFYREASRFLFFKNGLPFQARHDEAVATLHQLRGEAERPKIKNTPKDLPLPKGMYRDPGHYFSIQNEFPQSYGIGPEGLPSHASKLRRAQAKQLKAYLLVFEQFLANQIAQLAQSTDCFSLDPGIRQTYFIKELTQDIIDGYDDLVADLDKEKLEKLIESEPEFLQRRNRFLDHLLARFGEQLSDYTLLLSDLAGRQKAQASLIDTKLALLKGLPEISRYRYRSFDTTGEACAQKQYPVLKKRVNLLLGIADLKMTLSPLETIAGKTEIAFELMDWNNRPWLTGTLELDAYAASNTAAYRTVVKQMSDPEIYRIDEQTHRLTLEEDTIVLRAAHPDDLTTEAEAQKIKAVLLNWSAHQRTILVEHVLLRPKFPGDALYPVCSEGVCKTCGFEDPYSFRLTWVMPGWTSPYNVNLDLRAFAERTIRQETPTHLLSKICWVGNKRIIDNPCEPLVNELAALLLEQNQATEEESCDCAKAIYSDFSRVFNDWYHGKTLDYFDPDVLRAQLASEFESILNPGGIECAAAIGAVLWNTIVSRLTEHFAEIARYGRQFERFETAWCLWLEANASINWTEQRLQERVEALLAEALLDGDETTLCRCAAGILADYGTAFSDWLNGYVENGLEPPEDLSSFEPAPIVLCSDAQFKTGTEDELKALLDKHYQRYIEVSYRLRIVVNLLADLKSIYPEATLHDCDDGSDHNPVRLDKTALGSLNAVPRPFENP
ncbi:hypothetical protein [Methylotuvimicrobium buryatense]|uniref:Uncharacterized protein n=1 Tax=Methylotuvimicrobium buryatense TaxID=95641 RepID=A0A4P9UQX0_METBY|nr:hypothetical protein [Methylotuvimicrobium buryatense]QCW82691.1 hypothetical protein EQU24_10925 [Methylotuvimicrobium buryatense]